MSKIYYGKIFAIRSVICFILIMTLFLSAILRVTVIATNDYQEIATNQASYRIEISRLRGTIYDCNMKPITNSIKRKIAAISPSPAGITTINRHLFGEELENVLDILRQRNPAVCTVYNDIFGDGVATTTLYDHTPKYMLASHIIGYTDDTGHGVIGLEKAYDEILYSNKKLSAVFTSDGMGNVIEGINPYFENDLNIVNNGIVTTLDMDIQSITERALSNVDSGCAIVSEVDSGKIRAIASVPKFSITNIGDSLDKENSPMLNRALLSYNVGSIFKPVIAATAIENGYEDHTFNCTGSLKIVDRTFKCHKLDGHNNMELCSALSQSCNCYFYNLALTMGGDVVYKTISSLSFNNKIKIADNLYTAVGNLPSKSSLKNEGALANLSIGQGSLMASPIAMLNLYTAIASDGSYYLPSIVEGTIIDGVFKTYDIGNKTHIMKKDTAEKIRGYLKFVISDGTGKEASPNYCTAAGKTATAQTGRYYEDGTEITNSWFCGFFPSQNPKYVVVIMCDTKPKTSTAALFAQIADDIIEHNIKNGKNDD